MAVATAPSGEPDKYDGEYDVVICGGGAGGLSSAVFARWQGHDVAVLETDNRLVIHRQLTPLQRKTFLGGL